MSQTYEQLLKADTGVVSDYLWERQEAEFPTCTVPAAHYTSPAFAAREEERLWPTVWQMACRENDIPEAGEFVEYTIVDRSVLVVRGADGAVRAFRNACRHRGTALAAGQGKADCFNCSFHGWTFDLDGALRHVPAEWDFPGLDKDAFGLVPVRVESFDGWVYVNLDPAAPPLTDFLGDTITRHLQVSPDERMWKAWHLVRPVACNWKVLAEAFFEAYHLSRTHPQMVAYTGDTQSFYDTYGLHARVCTPVNVPSELGGGTYSEQEILDEVVALMASLTSGDLAAPQVPDGGSARAVMGRMVRELWGAQGVDLSDISDAELQDGILYFIFPNFKPFRGQAGHIAYRFRPAGHDPNECLFDVMNLLPIPGGMPLPRDMPAIVMAPGERFADYPATGVVGEVLDQDCANAPRIQKGLHGLDEIVLARSQERNIVAFHHNLERWLGA